MVIGQGTSDYVKGLQGMQSESTEMGPEFHLGQQVEPDVMDGSVREANRRLRESEHLLHARSAKHNAARAALAPGLAPHTVAFSAALRAGGARGFTCRALEAHGVRATGPPAARSATDRRSRPMPSSWFGALCGRCLKRTGLAYVPTGPGHS